MYLNNNYSIYSTSTVNKIMLKGKISIFHSISNKPNRIEILKAFRICSVVMKKH